MKLYAQWLVFAKAIGEQGMADLKLRHDVYFVYYLAANVDLASGNLRSYHANVKRAEEQLDLMEATVRNSLAEFEQTESNAEKRIFPRGL